MYILYIQHSHHHQLPARDHHYHHQPLDDDGKKGDWSFLNLYLHCPLTVSLCLLSHAHQQHLKYSDWWNLKFLIPNQKEQDKYVIDILDSSQRLCLNTWIWILNFESIDLDTWISHCMHAINYSSKSNCVDSNEIHIMDLISNLKDTNS